jgi:MFS family permease
MRSKKWHVLGIFLLATIGCSAGQMMALPLAPFLIRDLHFSKIELGLVFSSVSWGPITTAIFWGWLTDRIGEKNVLPLGAGIVVLGLVAFSCGTGLATLVLSGLLIGTGFACLLPLTNRGIAVWFPASERALAIGIKQAGVPVGAAVVAAFLPTLALAGGWRFAVRMTALFTFILGAVSVALYWPAAKSKNISTFSCGATATSNPAAYLLPGKKVFVNIIVLGLSFIMVQHVVQGFTVPYFQEVLAFSEVTCGYYLALVQISGGLGRPVYGFVNDYFFKGRHPASLFSLALVVAGATLLFSLLAPASSFYSVLVLTFVLGFTSMAWIGPYYALLTEALGSRRAGFAGGLGQTINSAGIAAASPIFGWIIDTTNSYRVAFQAFAAWLVFAAVLLFMAFYASPLGGQRKNAGNNLR